MRKGGALSGLAVWAGPLPFLGLLAVAAWAFGATFWLGRVGFMPLDSPITWDIAWRMMHGQVPCRDFNTPGAVVPGLIQILFFKFCGVNWWGYLLHAGLCSAAFSVGTALFLSRLGASVPVSLFVGAMEGWHFNTPIGLPYYDQYSYFFAFLALAATTFGVLEAGALRRAFWLSLVPALCVATILSKVSPGLYALALLPGAFLLGSRKGERLSGVLVLVASGLATAALLGLFCLVEGVSLARVWESFFGLPSGIGHERWASVRWEDWKLQTAWRMGRLAGLWFSLAAAALAALALVLRRGGGNSRDGKVRVLVWIGLAAPWVDLLTFLSADQQALNYLAYGVLALGAGVAAFGLSWGRTWRPLYWVLFGGMVLISARVEWGTAWKMVLRNVNDFGLPETAKLSDLPKAGRELKPMLWIVSGATYTEAEFWQVVDFLREKKEPFLVAGQNTLPYAFCGQVNPFPAAWLHAGLTFPRPGDPRRPAFDAWAVERLKAAGVKWLVVDPSWGNWLDDLPYLRAWAEKATGPEVDIATWRLIPVDVADLELTVPPATPPPAAPTP